jgi:imidazoleglycerol-phosphate dehydratase
MKDYIMSRAASTSRETKETRIKASIDLDGKGNAAVSTGVGFFDHMLAALAKHSLFDIELSCKGDTQVDDHHTVEDCGIVLGQLLAAALGDRQGVRRYGFASTPLDEALTQATVDLAGRPFFCLHGRIKKTKVGEFDAELAEDFFQALSTEGKLALHLQIIAGRNQHHLIETMFKATARALRDASEIDPRQHGVASTKGTLV